MIENYERMEKQEGRKYLVFSLACLVEELEKWEGRKLFCLVEEKGNDGKCNL